VRYKKAPHYTADPGPFMEGSIVSGVEVPLAPPKNKTKLTIFVVAFFDHIIYDVLRIVYPLQKTADYCGLHAW
jgi:hypothetical protein